MADGRGGYRQPANPAATSGPGALSQRTDGGAGSSKQPIRVPTGGAYGEAGALEAQQQAAPMAAGGAGGVSGPQPGPGGGAVPTPGGVFGATERPGEANDAMPMVGPDMGAEMANSPDLVLRRMYQLYRSPYIARLIGTTPQGTPAQNGPPPAQEAPPTAQSAPPPPPQGQPNVR